MTEKVAHKIVAKADDVKKPQTVVHAIKCEKTGEILLIQKSPFTIGRLNTSDCVIPNPMISRNHATLIIKNDVCYLVDNRSLNKTYVNGAAVVPETEHALSDGDKVRLYNEQFIYMKRCN